MLKINIYENDEYYFVEVLGTGVFVLPNGIDSPDSFCENVFRFKEEDILEEFSYSDEEELQGYNFADSVLIGTNFED
jgi:hypothetical protein